MNRTQSFFRDKVVMVTGASSGIGQELAWQLGQAGAKLTLAARRTDLLENLAQRIAAAGKTKPVVVACDRSEEHTSELQSPVHLVCRLLLEKKKTKKLSQ